VAGAVGDALGAPVEFLSAAQIEEKHGVGGSREYGVAFGFRGTATDDTQMTLFTLEGLIRAHVRYRLTGELAVAVAEAELRRWSGHEEQLRALRNARELAGEGVQAPDVVSARLRSGWVGEEALAIALYAALSTDDLGDGLRVAVNHSGDSDSTGSICGNILGALHGQRAIPNRLRDHVGLRGLCLTLAYNALTEFGEDPPNNNFWLVQFPPE
jgi:ADP-ribosylglycohydrolase